MPMEVELFSKHYIHKIRREISIENSCKIEQTTVISYQSMQFSKYERYQIFSHNATCKYFTGVIYFRKYDDIFENFSKKNHENTFALNNILSSLKKNHK